MKFPCHNKYFWLSLLAFTLPLLSSCHNSVDPDFSQIADPYARWKAYKYSNYSIEQVRGCFCSNGGVTVRVIVKSNAITDVINLSTASSLAVDQWPGFKTVD